MVSTNNFGLTRTPSEAVKRQIRQNSGFGCVVCGIAVGDYEHVDPEFHEATEHDPEKMTFLCAQHHALVTRKRISKDTVKEHMRAPAALQKGFAHEQFYVGMEKPTIIMGPITAIRSRVLLMHEEVSVLGIDEPEAEGGPYRINAEFRNRFGQVVFSIRNNEWRARSNNWDVYSVGPRTYIRNSKGDVALVIRVAPPNELYIEKMNMQIDGFSFKCDGRKFHVETPNGLKLTGHGGVFTGCDCVLSYKQGALIGGVGCERWEMGALYDTNDTNDSIFSPSRPVHVSPYENSASSNSIRGVLWEKVKLLLR